MFWGDKMKEEYEFTVPKGGSKAIDILDYCFNETTQSFLIQSGLAKGLSVLELGCGSGEMACWIADRIGKASKIIAIDSNFEQVKAAQKRAEQKGIDNIEFICMDVFDIKTLNRQFDLIYNRFILHHLLKPKSLIDSIYTILKQGGIYVAEEGIVNHAFTYPYCDAFGTERFRLLSKHENTEGIKRDANFGIKLYHAFCENNFKQLSVNLVAPILKSKEEKTLLIEPHYEFKNTFLDSGGTEQTWQKQLEELHELINDNTVIIGFYQSCQVSGRKQ